MVTPKQPRPFRGMRRLTLTGAGTATVLVLLFSYRTSTGEGGTDNPQAVAPAQIVSGSQPSTGQSSPAAAPARGHASTPAGSSVATSASEPTRLTTTAAAAPTSHASAPTAAAPTSTSSNQPSTSTASVTVDGAQEMTRYGVVQVRVTITGGRIADVTTLQFPSRERRDIEINNQALPQLRAEVLAAQSANVDAVSGATYTSEGYLTSLQAALDAAGFQS